ncbi:hypothetical protein [Nocardia sp. CA-290969]|uniref:phage tail tube protein n=1 Tax=Nocardia sp. CA-290969 TaxID=3239986 RepID=UPI003D91DDC1
MAMATTKTIGAGTPNMVTGGVLVAPLGSTLPTTAAAAYDAAFKALGYVSEDGLESQGERTVEAIKDWNADIIAQLQTEHSARFGLTLYAVWDPDVLKEVFGEDNVTTTAATPTTGTLITVEETGSILPYRSWSFDMAYGGKKLRLVLPNAKITEVTESAFVSNALAGFQVVVEAFKDDVGVKVYRYYDDGVFSV